MGEITVDADIQGIDQAHPAFQGAWGELLADLRAIPGLRAQERDVATEPAMKAKGWETELIVGLTGTGTVTGLVQALKLWLGRDRRRSVTVTVRFGGQDVSYEIAGENISTGTLQAALDVAVQREHGKRK
jgi:Effector Associated Constant Component 1